MTTMMLTVKIDSNTMIKRLPTTYPTTNLRIQGLQRSILVLLDGPGIG